MFQGAQVSAIFEDQTGTIWVGTQVGLDPNEGMENVTAAFTTNNGLSSDSIQAITEDTDGNLWFGTPSGLNRYRDGKFTVVVDGKSDVREDVSALYLDKNGVLWIGTRGRRT